jgi:hypothetical protein
MASLFFPQLSIGALVQYPFRKTRHLRTIVNTLADGTIIAIPDSSSGRLKWELIYQDLSSADLALLQTHFTQCSGPWQPFVFIDPTDNMLSDSSDLTTASWQLGSNLTVQAGATDPTGASNAFLVTNNGQIAEQVSQTLTVPAWYQYCFSVYIQSATPSQIQLIRQADTQQTITLPITTSWTRLISSGQLTTQLTSYTVAISLLPGQQIKLFGPQLEPQIAPSHYRPTLGAGGVYPNAHWSVNTLTISAGSPSLFNASCIIETNL